MTGIVLRKYSTPLAIITLALFLAGCSGGGGATSSTGSVTPGAPVGPSGVIISLAAAPETGPASPAVAVAGGSSVPTPDSSYKWPEEIPEPTPRIAHVYMEVVKVTLMPEVEESGGEDIDQDGDPHVQPYSSDNPRHVTIVPDSPIRIDLLKLDNDKRFARFLNKFDSIPAGTYDKIRVYYRNVKVLLSNGEELRFHPTANSRFDIHFRQGHELEIRAESDTTQPDGWVKFFRVDIDFVGLKIKVVPRGNGKKGWEACKVILRPQIFAVAGKGIVYSVAGTASDVVGFASPTVSGTFDVSFGTGPGYPRTIHAAFNSGTTWAFSDDVLGGSPWIVDVSSTAGVGAFRDRATVEAIGRFNAAMVFQARDIVFTFPDVRLGTADNVWLPPDNVAFIVRSPLDNVVVFPKPDRFTAYYDNLAAPHGTLTQAAVDNNVEIKARGYFDTATESIEAFWISIGETLVGP